VPFYRLPEIFRAIPELQKTKVTSLHPADIFRCLRLKVWDVETQRMIGVRNLKRKIFPTVTLNTAACENSSKL
jgi:omega-6 fatty acid desaturase (delta-12 desaturase)